MKRTTLSERALVHAPRGRDAALAVAILDGGGIVAETCPTLPALLDQMNEGAAAIVVTEEALITADLAPLCAWIEEQQEWSDLPFILLTHHGGGIERNPAARRYLDALGNVTFLERPFHPTTLISLVRSALRGRRRQYEARARLEALHRSEARFRAAVGAVQGVLWTNNAAGAMEGEQPGWEKLTGQSFAEYQGYGWSTAVHPDDARATIDAWNAAVAAKHTFVFEHRIRRHDGAWRRFSIRAIPILDRAGEVEEWVGVHTDVTEQRSAEQQLRDLNARLEARVTEALAERTLLATIVETTDTQVQALDLDYRWLAINSACANAYERIYGKRPKVGQSLPHLLSDRPEQLAAMMALWARALAGKAFTEVGEFGDSGPHGRCYEMKFEVLRGPDGTQTGAFLTSTDITERVQQQRLLVEAESARREADALYRAYFENTPEALFVIRVEPDGGFVVEEINPAHEAGVGLKLDDIRGKRMEDVVPETVARQVLKSYRHVVETGAVHQYREVFDVNGESQHWDTSLVPIKDENGRILRLIGSSRNVTRQIVAEEALRQSQKMEAMGQLTGGVAHDFNNLLTPILGTLDMLQRKSIGGQREQRLISGAAKSAERAKVLVQRLLAFARRQPLQLIAVDVVKLVRNMAELVASTTGPQIKVVVETPHHLPPAKAETNQLEMALLNLAVNARDAMPDGGTLRISVSAERVQAGSNVRVRPGQYVRVSVADTGTGMNEATLARAVEPFFSTKGVGKGTGLGLSMVHGLASQLGGALIIKSKLGLGTNIELWLPQTEDAPDAPAATHNAEPAQESGTALLVDDDEFVRLSTADMLEDLGYRVVETASAEEALIVIGNGARVDLVVTDHLMPGMTGTDLARTIYNLRPTLPVLVVSGYAEVDGIASDLPRLMKPFRKDELAASLVRLSSSRSD